MTTLRQRATALAVIVLTILAVAQLLAGAEPVRLSVNPGLIELRLNPVAPVGADVSWDARAPLSLNYRTYELGNVLITHATTGQLVIVSDVIDWEAKVRTKTTWIVDVKGGEPGPGPDPTPPQPAPPPGLAGEIYKLAKPINEPAKSLKYAANFETISSKIGAGAITTIEQARAEIIAINQPLATGSAAWTAVGVFIAQQISKQPTLESLKDLFDITAIGLRAAGTP